PALLAYLGPLSALGRIRDSGFLSGSCAPPGGRPKGPAPCAGRARLVACINLVCVTYQISWCHELNQVRLPGMTSTPADAPGRVSPVDGLAQLSFVIQGLLERQAAAHDLTMAQVRLLGVLRDRTPTMLELARLLGLDKSSTTG